MAQQILSITQINEYIRAKMDDDQLLNGVAVRGEISNYKVYPSGHHYFTLKDEGAALKCVMFKGNAMRLRFRPDNGMKVIAMGKISVYPRDGAYQLYCTAMAMDGIGVLYAAFEQLKKKLEAQADSQKGLVQCDCLADGLHEITLMKPLHGISKSANAGEDYFIGRFYIFRIACYF